MTTLKNAWLNYHSINPYLKLQVLMIPTIWAVISTQNYKNTKTIPCYRNYLATMTKRTVKATNNPKTAILPKMKKQTNLVMSFRDPKYMLNLSLVKGEDTIGGGSSY